jgi:cell wall-associated NlpC family hydrolase
MVDSGEAKAGDLVFYDSPAAGDQNHVGLVIGKNSDGSLLVVHCSSSQNGVVVGEAWSSGFKYVRSPLSLE